MKRLPQFFALLALLLVLLTRAASAQVSVTTWQVNNQHTGNNNRETQLTPALISSPGNFGLLAYPQMDGQSFGQPLLVSAIHAGRDMAFVATERCNIYGFDITAAGVAAQVWTRHLVPANASGFVPPAPPALGTGDMSDAIGLTTTPVIDTATNTLYVVSKLYDPSGSSSAATSYHQYLYALDLVTGNPKFGSPIEIAANFPGATGSDAVNGVVSFNAFHEHLRCAMTLDNGVLWLAFASHSDTNPYHGEVIGYNPSTLQVVKTFNTSPYNKTESGLWNGGAGTAFDPAHNMFLFVGNGDYAPAQGNWGESAIKLSTTGSAVPMSVDTSSPANWFTPAGWSTQLNNGDLDLGAGGLLLLSNESPSITNNKSLVIGGGKGAVLYVLDHDNLGGLNTNDSGALQQLASPGDWIFSTPAYYNGSVYLAASGAPMKQYKVSYNATNSSYLSLLYSSKDVFNNKGATPFISSNGKADGIVWAQTGSSIRAYDASNVSGAGIFTVNATVPPNTNCQTAKFSVPMVANGKLFFAGNDTNTNKSYLFVCGLLTAAPGAPAAASNATAVPLSAYSAQVSWKDNSGGAAQFYIKRSASANGPFTIVSGVSPISAGTTAYLDTGLTASTAYYYQVVAANNAGNANPSNVAGATTFPTYAESGLVAFLPLEEVDSTTTVDATGHGHTGTIPSGEGNIAQGGGFVNNGFHAHGTGQASSRVVVPDAAGLRFTAGQSFTLSAWVMPDAARGTEQTVIAKARNAGTGYYGVWLDGNGHWLGRGPAGDIVSTATATAAQWAHVALVQDGTAGTRKLYVNGALSASGVAQDASGVGDLWLTQQNISGNIESMPGNIDEVRLYNRALAAGEITNLMSPPVVEADSIVNHGTGTNPLGVAIWPTATKKTESRQAPSNAYKVVYTFAAPLQAGITSSVGTATLDATNPVRVTVALSSGNRTTTNVVLSNVLPASAPAGSPKGTASIPFNVLWGDVNGDSVVNTLDASIESNSHANAVNAANARLDINCDGVIDGKDDALVTGAKGTSLGAPTDTNLAIFQPAYANSPTSGNVAANAVDNDTTGSRWESDRTDPQWIYVDLGAACTIHQIVLNWENAAGKTYTVDVSNDPSNPGTQNAANWTRLATETNNTYSSTNGSNPHPPYVSTLTGTYRYVRMFGTTRTTPYGYSLYDFQVIGQSGGGGGGGATVAPVVSGGTATSTSGMPFSYQIVATNNPTSYGVQGLPSGYAVNSTTGVISGTHQGAGNATLTLNAFNSAGKGTATLQLTVKPAPPVINSATTATATVGTAFSYKITAYNSPTSFGATNLPPGLSVNTATGLISGTPTVDGTSSVSLSAKNSTGTGTATLTLTVKTSTAADTNLAAGKNCTALSTNGGNVPNNATDSDTQTSRWESTQKVDPEWIYVDLGAVYTVDTVAFNWENAAAKDYLIQVATTNPGSESSWTLATPEITDGTPGTHSFALSTPMQARYVRMYGKTRTTIYGYSIIDFQVMGH